MNTQITSPVLVSVSLILSAAVVSTLSMQYVSARITEETTCTNHGGHESDGSCNGNTDSNKKEEECSAKNPAGHEPGGHNPC
jgi:hypothetical protein